LDLTDPPSALFGLGRRRLLRDLYEESPTITIVGARRASRAGLEIARSLASDLAGSGAVVVSGMALGIDAEAHRGALDSGRSTVAVLGSGPDVCYPRRSEALYRKILESGLILSELPPGSQPRKWTFPARNRLMAALGHMTVVVEARMSSGSLITASMAADLGREIGAVPAGVAQASGQGVNSLLRDGAHVVRHADDVLDTLIGPGMRERWFRKMGPDLPPETLRVLEWVEREAGAADQIALAGAEDPATAAVALARLELSGYLIRDAEGRFVRTSLAVPGSAL
jgi:DNA processing protein